MAALIGLWAILVSIIGLNGFAAGVVAVLHLWRPEQSRGGKVLFAVVFSGLLPTSLMIPSFLFAASVGTIAPVGMMIGAVVMFVLALVISLPGALIVARKLDAPGDHYRAFE